MIVTAQRIEKLGQIGVDTPSRPKPPFDVLPAFPTDVDRTADAAYQAACGAWTNAVAAINFEYFPDAAPSSSPPQSELRGEI